MTPTRSSISTDEAQTLFCPATSARAAYAARVVNPVNPAPAVRAVAKLQSLGSAVGDWCCLRLAGGLLGAGLLLVPAMGYAQAPSTAPAEAQPKELPPPVVEEKATKKKAVEEPTRTLTRQEYLENPGIPRAPSPLLDIKMPLAFKAPTAQEKAQFESMRRGQINPDPKRIDAFAKFYVYQMTDPEGLSNLSNLRGEIVNDVKNARGGGGTVNEEFLRAFKTSLIKYASDTLNNNLLVRINALLLINDLQDGTVDVTSAIPVYVKVLQDSEQPDAMHYLAIKGLDLVKKHKSIKVEEELKAAEAIMTLIRRNDVQDLVLEQAVQTLGNLQRVAETSIPDRVEVATALANFAVDPKNPVRLRIEAAVALGKLHGDVVRDWNYELQALVVAMGMRDLLSPEGQALGGNLEMWYANEFGIAMQVIKQESEGKKPESMDGFFAEMDKAIVTLLDRSKPGPEGIQAWIDKQMPPKNLKLAPAASPVKMPAK